MRVAAVVPAGAIRSCESGLRELDDGHTIATVRKIFFNFRYFRGLCALKRQGSFRAAAPSADLSASSLRQAVLALEAAMGISVVRMRPHGAFLTTAGNTLAAAGERALFEIDRVGQELVGGAAKPTRLTEIATGAQLFALYVVARHGSLRAGARAAGVSQGAIHRSLNQLNRAAGKPLTVDRDRSGIALTPAALKMAMAVRQVLNELAIAIEGARQGAQRPMTIGVLPSAGRGLIPRALATLCARHPAANIRVSEGSNGTLMPALLAGTLDMLVGWAGDGAPGGLTQLRVGASIFELVCRDDHPLARSGSVTIEKLRDYPWIVDVQGSAARRCWEAFFRSRGAAPPVPKVECASTGMARDILLEGGWLGFLASDQFALERELGLLLPIAVPIPAASLELVITVREGWTQTPLHEAFVESLRNACLGAEAERASDLPDAPLRAAG